MKCVSIITVVAPLLLTACTHKVQVEPIKVEPIHVTVDVRVKVDRELESFFDFEEEYEPIVDPVTGPDDVPIDEPDDLPVDEPDDPVDGSDRPASSTEPMFSAERSF